jgi:hypothetical protein
MKGVVVDAETKEKIPFVNIWVENESIGTTSDLKGAFEIAIQFDSPRFVVFSAIGFETRRIISDSLKDIIELKPMVTELDEVIITPKKRTQKLTIGKFKKSEINHYFACGTEPWIVARYFAYQDVFNKTPFLDKIRVLTNSDIKDAKFSIRLYDVNDNGEPEGYMYDKSIIGIAHKGIRETEVDFSHFNIRLPKKGFFIAVEWLIVDENRYAYDYAMKDPGKRLKGISYEPEFGTIPAETDENSWVFYQGKWRKLWSKRDEGLEKYKDKYSLVAIELTLTD